MAEESRMLSFSLSKLINTSYSVLTFSKKSKLLMTGLSDCMFLSCHVHVSEWMHAL